MWIALNGDNRFFSWDEICNLEPEEQHDFMILSRIYNRSSKYWRDRKKAEEKMKSDIKDAQRKTGKHA